MSFKLPHSLQFLHPYTSANTIGIGITELPTRNFFQSIGDYFAEKSGDKRISFLVFNEKEISFLNFRGETLLNSSQIDVEKIEKIAILEGKSEDQIISLLNCEVEILVSIDKQDNKKTSTSYFKILPAFFGLNLEKINSPNDIQWALENLRNIQLKYS